MKIMEKLRAISLKAILGTISVGIWVIVLQNAGIIPRLVGSKNGIQTVYVKGGNIDADVRGAVNVDNVRGTVNVSGDVDVNIEKVQGRTIGSHKSYTIDGRDYHSIDVFKSNW
jgi:hypothetical protein